MIWLKLKLRDKNRFLIRTFKEKITLYEIKEEKDVCYVKIDRQDKEKIKKMWFVKILDEKNIGLSRVKEKIYQNRIFLFSSLIGLILLFLLSHVMVSVNVIHESKEIRDFLEIELAERGIKKNTWKKNYNELEEIKEDILNSFPDKLEWLEIEIKGMNYIVRVEERKLNDPNHEEKLCHLVALKDGIIKEMVYEKGMSLVKQNDAVKKGDILISGIIKNNEEEVGYTCAKGSIYAEVWYKVTVSIPLTYEEATKTGKKRWNFKLNDTPIFKNRLTNFSEEKHLLLSLFGQKLYFVVQNEEEKQAKTYSEEEALEEATLKATSKVESTLKDKEKILTKKVLKKEVNDSTMVVEVFVVVLENIAQTQEFTKGE